jgi:GGDEF domain-containing protein
MNRARRNEGVLTVAMVNIDHRRLLDSGSAQGRLGAMRSVVSMFGKNLRDEDVMAPFSDTELAILLPDLDAKAAKTVVERLLELVAMLSVDLGAGDQAANLQGAAGVAPYFSGDNATMDELISRSRGALDSMRDSTYGRVMISGESAINDIQSAKRISK